MKMVFKEFKIVQKNVCAHTFNEFTRYSFCKLSCADRKNKVQSFEYLTMI